MSRNQGSRNGYSMYRNGCSMHKELSVMCDYSLESVRSRAAEIGDKLVTRNFGPFTRGFAAVGDLDTAVCILSGTELAFARNVSLAAVPRVSIIKDSVTEPLSLPHKTAIFRQIHKEVKSTHHDALEFPDGQVVLLTRLREGQEATVLQLPAEPRSAEEAKNQERVSIVA
jgi:hypothetical protein